MRQYKLAIALLSAAVLAGCGGGSSSTAGSQATKIQFSRQVTFGDSLSDVGAYAVGEVAALHGGKYTVNTLTPTPQNWTELMAITLGLSAPCAAQTGLDGLAAEGFAVPVVNHSGCYGYAQGGARVTLPYGPGNALLAASLGGSATLGQLTVPVVTQIQNHLNAVGGKFSGSEIVFVLAGANDVFVQLDTLNANATAAGTAAGNAAVTNAVSARVASDIASGACTPTDAQASNCQAQAEGELWQASFTSAAALQAAVTAQVTADISAGTCAPANAATTCAANAETELVTAYLTALGNTAGAAAGNAYAAGPGASAAIAAMAQAGTELAGYVNNMIIGNGAKYVTVVNIPDIGTTPSGNAQSASVVTLIDAMVSSFNLNLQAGLAASGSNVLLVDANTESHLNTQNPGQYGITNATTPACNLTAPTNPLGSSLTCTTANTIAGDVSHYLFADSVHPTPYGYSLLAKFVATQMALKGWL